ncbi:tripartite tricarboxylate transporter substrate binding protein [Variovorax sp. EBFNA2]|uniref:Bug family tripartite tricarboxylate transporter substrate binding protein n=1 Tax=Variovorax sp. EBFNA2 TaxID=3342097 RepID=UPI0029C04010|nr:tripartite tricarboxylate transporter substrate binding protein [Variovorax boronicumulans]WPG41301.1 tripartite tricarboxylate transporter substrate binding protein [Variovorax boronicumulans]
MRRRKFISLTATAVSLKGGMAWAEGAYPNKPIRLIVPYSPGGGTDNVARIVAQKLGHELGQPVIVENRPGAGGIIAFGEVLRSKADGYTLTTSTGNRSTLNLMNDKLSFNTGADFVSIVPLANVPIALVASNALPVKSMSELVKYVKTHSGLRFGTPGATTPNHLAGVQLGSMMGTDFVHVGYKGTAPALQDVIGGHLPLAIVGLSSAIQYLGTGQLKVLGMGGEKRSELAPQIPTISEGGVKGYVASYWYDITVAKKVPQHVIDLIHSSVNKVVQRAEVKAAFARYGYEAMLMSRDDYLALLQKEQIKWERVIKANKIRVD